MVRGQLEGVDFLLPLCRSWVLNSGHWSWGQVLLPAKLSHQFQLFPRHYLCFYNLMLARFPYAALYLSVSTHVVVRYSVV